MNKVNLKDNKFQIFDNVIPKEKQDELENNLLSTTFPWFYNQQSVCAETVKKHQEKNPNYVPDLQFTHRFVWDGNVESGWIHCLEDLLLEPLEESVGGDLPAIQRIKSNLQINNSFDVQENPPHIDNESDHYVGLYYVNDSDGDTVLYNDDKTEMTRISPKKGRIVFFKGNIYHTSSRPKDHRLRIVININFI